MNLLLVEDDKNIREMVYDFLTSEIIMSSQPMTDRQQCAYCKNIPLILSYWI